MSITTSSDERSSQSPSVARTKNFSKEVVFGSDNLGSGRESFRCVTTGVAMTYGGAFNKAGVGQMALPHFSRDVLYKL